MAVMHMRDASVDVCAGLDRFTHRAWQFEPSFEGEGLGDIQLNYRFQALCGEGERLSAPDYRSACHPMPRISHFSSTCRLSIGTKRSRVGALCGSNSDNCSASNFSSSSLLLVSLIEGGPVARIDTRYVQP